MTSLTFSQQQRVIQASLHVMDYIYNRGTRDGESGYLPGELYDSDKDLYGKSENDLNSVLTNLQVSLSKHDQNNLVKDILSVADKYYFQGHHDGANSSQVKDFKQAFGKEAKDKIKAILPLG